MSVRWALAAAILAAGALVASCNPMSILTGASGPLQESAPSARLELVAEGLSSPVAMAAPPDGSGRLLVVDQIGLIRVVTGEGRLLEEPFLDLRDRMIGLNPAYDERGLLGLAFHPDYAQNGRLFVHYTAPLREGAPQGWDNTERISEFAVSDDPGRADAGSERVILEVDEPQGNHQGGTVAFGPDGYLYISFGDGGGANDVGTGHTPDLGNGQDRTNLLGSILRIDVDGEEPYGIPEDNPFVDGEGAPEVYAYGLRNPYRFSFDRETGQLFAADAGQSLFEEASIIESGGNYGWHIREGFHCFDPQNPGEPPDACPDMGPYGEALVDPVIEYGRQQGTTVVGGYIYRGEAIPSWWGRYVFGDWRVQSGEPSGGLFVADIQGSEGAVSSIGEISFQGRPGGALGRYLLGFGQGPQGELYVLTTERTGPSGATGEVHRVAPVEGGADG